MRSTVVFLFYLRRLPAYITLLSLFTLALTAKTSLARGDIRDPQSAIRNQDAQRPLALSISLSNGDEMRPWDGDPVELQAATDTEAILISTAGNGLSLTLTAPATDDLIMGALLLIGEQTYAIQSADTITNLYYGGDIDSALSSGDSRWTLHSTLPNHPDGSTTLSINLAAGDTASFIHHPSSFILSTPLPNTEHPIPNTEYPALAEGDPAKLNERITGHIYLFGPSSTPATLHSIHLPQGALHHVLRSPRDKEGSSRATHGPTLARSEHAELAEGDPAKLNERSTGPQSNAQNPIPRTQNPIIQNTFSAAAEKVTRARTRNLTIFNTTH